MNEDPYWRGNFSIVSLHPHDAARMPLAVGAGVDLNAPGNRCSLYFRYGSKAEDVL